ncbi:hypothetical protein RND81_03G090100 [Saponaria officinalis]|uniref:TTF-type domain-containing protein n=1 Tax=Saponaria officinalis TaxID=3572 RepID=A0AAW1M662_SAPOF
MSKQTNLLGFLKRKELECATTSIAEDHIPEPSPPIHEHNTLGTHQIENEDLIFSLERDPGLRAPMWHHPIEKRNEIRRAYLKLKPYQPILRNFPYSGPEGHRRSFQSSWYKKFPDWLEYSLSKDAAFCFLCYLFADKPNPHTNTFTMIRFNNWKRVNEGKNCPFVTHVGGLSSIHNNSLRSKINLLNDRGHIRHAFVSQEEAQIRKNRLRLETTIDVVRLLTLQACPLRGHDESANSDNKGNFLEFRKAFSRYNDEVSRAIEHTSYNAQYIAPSIQKEILHIISTKVRNYIREEIGESKFCIMVDEARDETKREKMAIVLRFVDKKGLIKERFFDLVHVTDTSAATLKKEVCSVFTKHKLFVENLRGQGYDGASNMRGEWNGLQALFLADCPYAYYVHCFAHRLQLALVAASKEVSPVHQFFSNLNFIINIIGASLKRHDELQANKGAEIETLLFRGELETGRGANQIGTLKKAGDTRWGSHLQSIRSLLNMYSATVSVLEHIMVDKSYNSHQRGDADIALNLMISYEFMFLSHLMREILGITDILCQALQRKSQDIANALKLVSTTKSLIQNLREDRWKAFVEEVNLFCQKHDSLVPEMGVIYVARKGRARRQQNQNTVEHHFRVNVFYVTIDKQLQEINSRFNDKALGLLTLTSVLAPYDRYKNFDCEQICTLAEKYYPSDFTTQEKIHLRYQLQHFLCEVKGDDPTLRNLSILQEPCQCLAETGKSDVYFLIDRLIRLVLTLPVSTATTERAFSGMKVMKTRLRNKMEDDFLADSLVIYIEREISKSFSIESIVDDFKSLKDRRVLFSA